MRRNFSYITLVEIVQLRSDLTGEISKQRQAAGQFEVFRPDQRLPDARASMGEFITYGYEANPDGGRDLVRVIRIFPGENLDFDQVRERERAVSLARLEAVRLILDE